MNLPSDYRPEPPLSHDLYYHIENGVPVLDTP
jgi:hypothetical protein